MRIHRLNPARGAFTLVELLVVLGIMLVLMSLAVVVATSGILDNHRLSAGSDRVSGWLLQSRAKAFRDRLPRGIRFVPDANGFVREAQFIEVPEPYVPNPTQSDAGYKLAFRYTERNRAPGPGTYIAKEAFVIGNPSTSIAELMTVVSNEIASGDVLKIASFTTLNRIRNVIPTTVQVTWNGVPTTFQALKLDMPEDPGQTPPLQADSPKLPDLGPSTYITIGTPNPPPPPFQYLTTQFSFLRQARPMLGEQPLKFSANTAAQISTVPYDSMNELSATAMSLIPRIDTLSGPTFDVLFSPTGEVLNNGGLGRVVLWIRNPDFAPASFVNRTGLEDRATYERAGEMALITVYCKTGAVATHPVGMPPVAASPYQYTKDGIASGL
jgi:prepilin-type N-terminal cleavage/methylation domain-containing protein